MRLRLLVRCQLLRGECEKEWLASRKEVGRPHHKLGKCVHWWLSVYELTVIDEAEYLYLLRKKPNTVVHFKYRVCDHTSFCDSV